MMKILMSTLSLAALLAAPVVMADDPEQLFATKACAACHALDDSQRVGPGMAAVQARYADEDQEAIVATLAGRIKNGNVGNWGQIPMPANAAITEEQAKILAEWVMTR
ncbi:c-type cytochrome [Halopseudomonas salegens]|uniref:Cytochrome c-551 n=1 Tax=Halopseudomonas salegens TaxID=1434072 RepID=A0A1H2HRF8_9GAMM|nr:c-type cytochrome [Halopseudomonas salegens]SDU34471.1 cytochrome c [Halopseudomonas salegens]